MSKKSTSNLLSEVTQGFLALNNLEKPDYVNSEGENYYFVGTFPEFLRQHISNSDREPKPLLNDAIYDILAQQSVEPC